MREGRKERLAVANVQAIGERTLDLAAGFTGLWDMDNQTIDEHFIIERQQFS